MPAARIEDIARFHIADISCWFPAYHNAAVLDYFGIAVAYLEVPSSGAISPARPEYRLRGRCLRRCSRAQAMMLIPSTAQNEQTLWAECEA